MASTARADAPLKRTFAQWYCLIAGATLALAGVLGFAADGSFDTGSQIQGDELIVFEVNGWHNLVHLGSGLVLLAAANYRPTAKSVAFAFGAVYAFVALWGLVDGDEVFNLFPVNPADNLLHIFLAAAAIGCALVSPSTKGQQRKRHEEKRDAKRAQHEEKEAARRDEQAATDESADGRFTSREPSDRERS